MLINLINWLIYHKGSIRFWPINGPVDTRFYTHNLILEDGWNDHFIYPKIRVALLALNHPLHVIKII